jgi:2-methylcitrate dehydratase PrpD
MRRNQGADVLAHKDNAILTRRIVLRHVGGFIAAAVLSPVARLDAQRENSPRADQPISPVMSKLSTYMSEARSRSLPGEVVEKAKHHILDTFAAMVSGSQLSGGHAAIQFVSAYGGAKVSTVVATEILCGPIEAAFANAEFGHSDETDDYTHVGGAHPGSSIVPAALALGENFGIGGMHFLRAVVLGYDIGIRATVTLNGAPSVHDSHGIVGNFGCAAAGGCAASLNAQQMRWLLDYTAQQTGSGLPAWQRDTDHIEKGFVFSSMGARNGVSSALMVHSGFNGVDDILSGPGNFLQAYIPNGDPALLIDQLGERYDITRTNIKKWTVGGPLQLPLDAMDSLLKQYHFEPRQVKQVNIHLAPAEATGIAKVAEMPDISLQYMMAVMMIDKTASFRAAHDLARMKDPAILRERAKIQLVPDEQLQPPPPKPGVAPSRVAIVEVTLNDGTNFSQRAEFARGTIDNPMDREEVVAKCRNLMEPILGTPTCKKLIEKVLSIEDVKDIRELRPVLQRA